MSESDAAPSPLNRRQALRHLGLGALLGAGLWPGALRAAEPSQRFQFIVINDTHYMTPECGEWLEDVVNRINGHEGIELCLLVGDLVEVGREQDLGAVREILRQLKTPTHAVIGNHDYLSASDRAAYEKLFPGQLNYSFEHRGWQFVGLDTTEGLLYEKTSIQTGTFRWLDESLPKLSPKRPTVVFTHFPLGQDVRYRPKNAEALLERFLPFNLQAVFCGHFHGFTERQRGQCRLTTNRCCALKRGNHDGTTEKGYFLCTAGEAGVTREFIEAPING